MQAVPVAYYDMNIHEGLQVSKGQCETLRGGIAAEGAKIYNIRDTIRHYTTYTLHNFTSKQ